MLKRKLRWIRIFPSLEAMEEQFVGRSSIVHSSMGTTLLLIRTNGNYFAFKNKCPHQGKSLEGCMVENDAFSCPYHRYKFSLEDGKGHGMNVDKYELKIDDTGVYVGKLKWTFF